MYFAIIPALLLVPFLCDEVYASPVLAGCKVLDLTHALNHKTPVYPVYTPFELQKRHHGEWGKMTYVEWNYMQCYEHTGTHADAPSHFSKNGLKIDQVKLESFIGEACVIDIKAKVEKNRDYEITVQDIKDWESEHGDIGPECFVLLNTGQDKNYYNRKAYFGADDEADYRTYHYAAFTGNASKYLIEKKIRAAGVDAISLDNSNDHGFNAHLNFLHHAQIPGIENMANLHRLPPRGATVMAAPLKIEGGSGSPLRAFAVGWDGPSDPCHKDNMASGSSLSLITPFSLLLCFLLTVATLF